MRDEIFEALYEKLSQGKNLSLLLGDLGIFQARNLFRDFPDRIFNLGILEPSMLSFAAGLSKGGTLPLIYSITPFITERSLEQIKLDICYNNNKVILLSAGATCDYSDLGPTHHCTNDIALLDNYPSISWFLPFNSDDSISAFNISVLETFVDSSYIRLSTTQYSDIQKTYQDIPSISVEEFILNPTYFKNICVDLGPDSCFLPLHEFSPDCFLKITASLDLDLMLDSFKILNANSSIVIRCPFTPPLSLFKSISTFICYSNVSSLKLHYTGSYFYDYVISKKSFFETSCQVISFK